MDDPPEGATSSNRPAYYAARPGPWRDWWTVLHPPYTAWHLAYVVIGAALAPRVSVSTLLATLVAFFLAVGVAAHALDELHGRPLRTTIPSTVLAGAVALGLGGACAIGAVGVTRMGWTLVPCIVAGPLLVAAYNAELLGGVIHTDAGFAAAWGAYPVLVSYVAQTGDLTWAPVAAATGTLALSLAQRWLSTPARRLRRQGQRVEGSVVWTDGEVSPVDRATLLAPLEHALRALSWGVVLLATGLALARLA